MQYYYLITGIIIFIIFSLICKYLSTKTYRPLSPTDRMLFIQQTGNINKYSVSALIATSVIFFAGMKNLEVLSKNIFSIYALIVVLYTVIFSFFIFKETKRLNISAKVRTSYTISRIFLLLGLGIFILSLFLCFNNINLTIVN